MNTAWLMIGGLRTLCAGDDADRLARGVADAAERSGFREYYHPRSGAGHGEQRFGWSTLLLDLPAGFSVPPAGVAPRA